MEPILVDPQTRLTAQLLATIAALETEVAAARADERRAQRVAETVYYEMHDEGYAMHFAGPLPWLPYGHWGWPKEERKERAEQEREPVRDTGWTL